MIGCTIRRFETCTSTNDEATKWAGQHRDRAPHGGVIVADTQTGGRGRLGRVWHSPAGENLYFSVVLRPQLPLHRVPPITLCAGLAVCEAVNAMGVAASIKWPNDVLVGDCKLAGVLTEMSTQSQHSPQTGPSDTAVIVGIGVNVNSRRFPPELCATSVANETGADCDRFTLLGEILTRMDSWVEQYCAHGVGALQQAFESHNQLRGHKVVAKVKGVLVSGRVVALAEDGSLLMKDDHGTEHRIVAGEVTRLENVV